ncbi:hypothetical protein [Promicromonospora sp. NPDC023987]|uniref:hypothetical protein n=1 Tax=Promicromonospora sp. NPDC023987 TaxID=3155360 RepID=UPI0033CB1E18
MTGPAIRTGAGDETRREGVDPLRVGKARLSEVGIHLRRLAAITGISANCVVQFGASALPLRSVDGSPIRVIDAHLRIPVWGDAAFFAAVLRLSALPCRGAGGDWRWRGWLAGDVTHDILLSITVSSGTGMETGQGLAAGDA